jgi:hypothetical protein
MFGPALRETAKLYFVGPVWRLGAIVSAALTFIGVISAILGGRLWMWLFFAAFALVVVDFTSFHLHRVSRLDPEMLSNVIGRFALVGDALAKANPRPEDRENDWRNRGREFLMDAYGTGGIALYDARRADSLAEEAAFYRSLLQDPPAGLPLRVDFDVSEYEWVLTAGYTGGSSVALSPDSP